MLKADLLVDRKYVKAGLHKAKQQNKKQNYYFF